MQPSLKDTRDQLHQDMLAFLWRQWSAIGLAGHAQTNDHWVIDPEALLLISSEFARHDARLFDEILDWLHLNGNLINLKRVFNIRKQYPIGNPDVLRAISKKLLHNSTFIKWKTISDKSLSRSTLLDEPQPLDELISLFPKIPWTMEALASCDKDFQACGLYRPRTELRGMSQPPSPHSPTNLIFKMRALFGCNSRSEILSWLLTHPSGHPAQIARDCHYFSNSVQTTLNEMAASGLVHISKTGREKHFRIKREDWVAFYGNSHQAENPPQWHPWAEIFATISLFHRALDSEGLDDDSELLQAALIQQQLEAFTFTQNYLTTEQPSGNQYLQTALEDLSHLLHKLSPQ